MTARGALRRLLYTDSEMLGLGFIADRIYAANSADSPDTDEPFIVIRHELSEKAFTTFGVDIVSFWVHLPRKVTTDYASIDNALDRIKTLVVNAEQYPGDDGWVLTAGSYVDTSGDLVDEAYNTITKNSTFRVAAHSMVTP